MQNNTSIHFRFSHDYIERNLRRAVKNMPHDCKCDIDSACGLLRKIEIVEPIYQGYTLALTSYTVREDDNISYKAHKDLNFKTKRKSEFFKAQQKKSVRTVIGLLEELKSYLNRDEVPIKVKTLISGVECELPHSSFFMDYWEDTYLYNDREKYNSWDSFSNSIDEYLNILRDLQNGSAKAGINNQKPLFGLVSYI